MLLSLPSKLKMHVEGFLFFSKIFTKKKKSPQNLLVIKAAKTLLELGLKLGCRLCDWL